MISLTIAAHAKVNLGLRIVGRKSDGYHLLHTLFAEIDYPFSGRPSFLTISPLTAAPLPPRSAPLTIS